MRGEKMDIKKVLIIGLILIALSTSLTAISAEFTVESNTLTIDGLNFTIPDGYSQVESEKDASGVDEDGEVDTEDIDGTVVDSSTTCDFKNGAGDEITVEVGAKANNEKIESINPANSEQKTIAGKDGYLIKDTDDGRQEYKFEYLEDGKIVKIVASSEDIIGQVIG